MWRCATIGTGRFRADRDGRGFLWNVLLQSHFELKQRTCGWGCFTLRILDQPQVPLLRQHQRHEMSRQSVFAEPLLVRDLTKPVALGLHPRLLGQPLFTEYRGPRLPLLESSSDPREARESEWLGQIRTAS